MPTRESSREAEEGANLLESRLAYHPRCLVEDATDPELPRLERLALVRERVARLREIRRDLERSA
jgi:hypothetical protein